MRAQHRHGHAHVPAQYLPGELNHRVAGVVGPPGRRPDGMQHLELSSGVLRRGAVQRPHKQQMHVIQGRLAVVGSLEVCPRLPGQVIAHRT